MHSFQGKVALIVGSLQSTGAEMAELLVDAGAEVVLADSDLQYIPTIVHQLSAEIPLVVMPNEEAYSYYDRTSKDDAPNWLPNTMTVASLEPYYLYNAIAHAPLVAPTPLLLIHGTTDFFLLPEYAQQAYDAAIGPKELVWIETHNHIELYDQDPYVSQAVRSLLSWLTVHLK